MLYKENPLVGEHFFLLFVKLRSCKVKRTQENMALNLQLHGGVEEEKNLP